jgi:ATP-binding cassette subfamily B protein
MAFVWSYVRRYLLVHLGGMAAITVAALSIETTQTYVLGAMVNALSGHASDFFGTSIGPLTAFVLFCAAWLLANFFHYIYSPYSLRMQLLMRVRVQDDLFAYLLNHAPRYFLDQASGSLVTRIRQAAVSSGAIIEYLWGNLCRLGVMLSVTGYLIWKQVPDLVVPFGVFLVVVTTASWLMAQRMRAYSKTMAKASSELSARMVDAVSNWDIVRSFARAVYERLTFAPFSAAEYDAILKLRWVATGMRLVLHVVSFGFLGWFCWGAYETARAGEMTAGMFTMIVSFSVLVASYVRGLGDNLFAYFEHHGIVSEALSTLLTPHEIVDAPDAHALRIVGGGIDVRDVSFAYHDGTPVFDRFTLTINPGERVGVVGASGAGKSTLIRLLRRQFPVSSGQILIDGQDIAHVAWDSLHEAIAEVPQSPGMFHRTVRDNVRYSRPEASDADVIAAAKLAHCHEFIAARPKGYDSVVGEKGMKLSGGERQRIAIARAFLKNAPILILDEATSSLDSEAEHLIQDGLVKLMEGRTVIAIAHRLSTIMHLDRIVVLDRGRIAEQGTHADLLTRGGIYARLWNRQAGGFL